LAIKRATARERVMRGMLASPVLGISMRSATVRLIDVSPLPIGERRCESSVDAASDRRASEDVEPVVGAGTIGRTTGHRQAHGGQ